MSQTFDMMLSCHLKTDVPQQVIDTLAYMTRKEDYEFNNPLDHPFFQNGWQLWKECLRLQRDSLYRHPGEQFSTFAKVNIVKSDEAQWRHWDRYMLTFRFAMHDDPFIDGGMIAFADWLAPYSETRGYVGYYHSDQTPNPTLIYFWNGRAHFFSPPEFEKELSSIEEGKFVFTRLGNAE